MNIQLGRNGLIGLSVGAAAGLGLIAFIVYKEIRKKSMMVSESRPTPQLFLDQDLLLKTPLDSKELEAQRQALAAVEAVVRGLSPEQQLDLRNQLDLVLSCVSSLRLEVAELRGGLKDIAQQIIQDVKKGVEESQRVRRRRHLVHRDRTDSTSSSSIYFSASQGLTSANEDTSEGGYSTAYAESDYTDRDTDREEVEEKPEEESEEEEDHSFATVLTLRQEDSQEEEEEEDVYAKGDGEEEGGKMQMVTEVPSGELALLLAQSDILHTGDASLKAEGFRLLMDNRAEYGDSREFLWRLARAYSDMYESAEDKQEKTAYALKGREEAESALKRNGLNAECHKWFAVLSGLISKHDSMHSKLKSTHVLKEHLDRAIALRDDDPMCFYLLGRWCYEMATLDWLERKAAAALYQTPPSCSLHDALENFLKAEELSPGFSRTVRLYIAKCHKALGNVSEAANWTKLAVNMRTNSHATDHDEETSNLESELRLLINSEK